MGKIGGMGLSPSALMRSFWLAGFGLFLCLEKTGREERTFYTTNY